MSRLFRTIRIGIGLWVSLALAGLGGGPAGPSEQNRMKPGDAPTPYSAKQIRKACPDGSWIQFQNRITEGPFQTLFFDFSGGDAEAVTVEVTTLDAKGLPAGPKRTSRTAWTELQSHASFLQNQTTITSGFLETFKGRMDCWRYEVTGQKDGRETLTTYWFAKALPGPPVLLEEYLGGKLDRRMKMMGRGKGRR